MPCSLPPSIRELEKSTEDQPARADRKLNSAAEFCMRSCLGRAG
jgi:hypothetical protein